MCVELCSGCSVIRLYDPTEVKKKKNSLEPNTEVYFQHSSCMKNTEEEFTQDDDEVPGCSHSTKPLTSFKRHADGFPNEISPLGLCLNPSPNTMIAHKFKKRLTNTVVEHQRGRLTAETSIDVGGLWQKQGQHPPPYTPCTGNDTAYRSSDSTCWPKCESAGWSRGELGLLGNVADAKKRSFLIFTQ